MPDIFGDNELRKPPKLCKGDTIAVVSPCHGWAGDEKVHWKYKLGVRRLEELGLKAVPAPNALKGSAWLSGNPRARAEDIVWAFENPGVKAIIASVGGNDSIRLIPYIEHSVLRDHPKIFIGYSFLFWKAVWCSGGLFCKNLRIPYRQIFPKVL